MDKIADPYVGSSPLAGYITRAELAKATGKSWRTWQRWEIERRGPPVVRLGKTPLYRLEAVRDWLAAQERKSGTAKPAKPRPRRAK